MSSLREALNLLGERRFRLFFLARTISLLGTNVATVALPFAVVAIHGSPSALGVVFAASFVPQILLLLVGGVLGDRLPRHRVMVVAELAAGGSQLALALLLITGQAHVWEMVVLSFSRGVATAFFLPSSQSVVPELVPPVRLQQANAFVSLSQTTTRLVGLSLGGVLIAAFGVATAIAIDAASFFIAALLLSQLALVLVEEFDRVGLVRGLLEGWHEFIARRWVVWVVLQRSLLNAFAVAVFQVVGPFVAARELGGAPSWAIILACQASGALVAGLFAIRKRPSRPLAAVGALSLLYAIPLVMLAFPAPLPLIAVTALAAGFGLGLSELYAMTTLQRMIPAQHRSRVLSFAMLGSFALVPLGVIVAGPLAQLFGTAATFAVAAGVVGLSSVTLALLPEMRALKEPLPADLGVSASC